MFFKGQADFLGDGTCQIEEIGDGLTRWQRGKDKILIDNVQVDYRY